MRIQIFRNLREVSVDNASICTRFIPVAHLQAHENPDHDDDEVDGDGRPFLLA
jgi:hypothetical protein